jgi:hypothetical protein
MGLTRKTIKLCTLGLAPIHYHDKEEREISLSKKQLKVQREMLKLQREQNRK